MQTGLAAHHDPLLQVIIGSSRHGGQSGSRRTTQPRLSTERHLYDVEPLEGAVL
jgi:hypothetical protein